MSLPLLLDFAQFVDRVVPTMKEPQFTVWSAVSGAPLESAKSIEAELKQLYGQPCKWHRLMNRILQEHIVDAIYEVGAGSGLKTLMAVIDMDAWRAFRDGGAL